VSQTLTDASSVVGGPTMRPVVLLIACGGKPLVRVVATDRAGKATLGRELATATGKLELDDGRASRIHAEVRWAGDGWRVRDLGSHNGTFVDGRKVEGEGAAADGALVRIGATLFWLVADGAAAVDDGVAVERGVVIGLRSRLTDDTIRRAATSPTLLVLGESGHRQGAAWPSAIPPRVGRRAGGPFVAGQLRRDRARGDARSRELFGHEEGRVLTGAVDDKPRATCRAGPRRHAVPRRDRRARRWRCRPSSCACCRDPRGVEPVGDDPRRCRCVDCGLVAATAPRAARAMVASRTASARTCTTG
jgi:hypothetical protein